MTTALELNSSSSAASSELLGGAGAAGAPACHQAGPAVVDQAAMLAASVQQAASSEVSPGLSQVGPEAAPQDQLASEDFDDFGDLELGPSGEGDEQVGGEGRAPWEEIFARREQTRVSSVWRGEESMRTSDFFSQQTSTEAEKRAAVEPRQARPGQTCFCLHEQGLKKTRA